MRIATARDTRSCTLLHAVPRRRSVSSVSLDDLADPHYDSHPAYGRAFPKASLRLRLKALIRVAPWLCFAVVKQLFLGDRLPALPNDGDGLEGGLMRRIRAMPHYVPFVARTIGRAFFHRDSTMFQNSPLTQALRRDGITVTRFTAQEREAILHRVSAPLAEVVARRESSRAQTFKGNQKCFTRQVDASLFAFVSELFARHGLLETAGAYLGRPVAITRLLLQINDPRDRFLYHSFPDAGLPGSQTDYMHIDRAYGCLKCVIYLSEVSERNGPFCYVLGSNRLQHGPLGGIVRRAVDRAGLAECDRATRQMFMALPKAFRKKSAFGSDLLDGSPNSEALLSAEYRFTSDRGTVALFDNLGIHRGAQVLEGQRQAIFVTLA